MVVLRADPWSPEYGMGFQAAGQERPMSADPFIERSDWSRPTIPSAAAPRSLVFVDGVRRVEMRLLAQDGDRRVSGLFGSYAVGAVVCDGRATFGDHRVCRAIILGGGMPPQPVVIPCGSAMLTFDAEVEAGTDPNQPLDRLQNLMRHAENSLASLLIAGGAPLVLADGPLNLIQPGDLPVVGVVKRFVRRYLEVEQEALLARLVPGERTPLFGLLDQDGVIRGFSWYARLVPLRPPWHDQSGIVRCEVRAGVGLGDAISMADTVTAALPAYAGRASDPRAPQNLAPVGGLEAWLRHRLGDRAYIRRALQRWLMSQP